MKLPSLLRKNIFPILILLFELTLFYTNYKTGTFLVGWDNLFPELNFPANLQRSLFAIWQEYRGLGLLDGMSFAANLPHWIFRYLLSLLLPLNTIRYVFFFLMHYLGGLGIFYLLNQKILSPKVSPINSKLISFSAALFYMFNLGIIQIFYAPFELFAIHFAFLPWLCLYLFNYLQTGLKKHLILFTLFSLFSIPQAHVPTIFLVYLLLVSSILSFSLIQKQPHALKKSLVIITAIFCLNAFWGLPYIYSTALNAKIITRAKINQMSSQDVYLENKRRGNLEDLISFKGFLLDTVETIDNQNNDYIMKPWRQHTQKPVFKLTTILLTFTALLGLLTSIIKKQKHLYPFIFCLLTCSFFLASNTSLIGPINDFLRTKFPLFGEVIRFSFTKFIILFIFCYTIFLALGLNIISTIIHPFFFLILIISSSLPAFKGYFFFNSLKAKIPQEYFQTINFFQSQPQNTRITLLPQPTFWSWRFYNWGPRGSGFLWYGLQQPSLDRAFDPWSQENENYYWEISQAIYSQNLPLFENVLEKYQINWLLLDENIINPPSSKALYYDQTKTLLSQSDKISLSITFGNIAIYQVNLTTPVNNFVFLAQNLPTIAPQYQWNNYDLAFLKNNHYISTSDLKTPPSVYYPFRSLFTNRSQTELEFNIKETPEYFIFQHTLPEPLPDYHLELPQLKQELIWINPQALSQQKLFTPEIRYDGRQIQAFVPKVTGYYSTSIDSATQPQTQTPKNCNRFSQGINQNQVIKTNNTNLLRLTSINSYNCSPSFFLPNLPHQLAYLITAKTRNIQGKSLLFWLENLNTNKQNLDIYLPQEKTLTTSYFIQPPMEKDGLGYTLHFDNISIGQVKTINDLGKIQVNPIPYHFLTNLSLKPPTPNLPPQTKTLKTNHPNPSLYSIPINQLTHLLQENTLLILSQSYHPGWQAYQLKQKTPNLLAPLLGKKIPTHLLINNWENGWQINNINTNQSNQPQKLVIIFLPQFLQYLGIAFLLIFPSLLLLSKRE